MQTPEIVSAQEWADARARLLVKEKELFAARDAMAAERRRMPWQRVSPDYRFDGPAGPLSLLDLFDGRRQLIVYRAFYEPGVEGWPERACQGCSLVADQVSHLAHLHARDTTLVFATRAPQDRVAVLTERMGWRMPWVTMAADSTFDSDFGVAEWHGTNAFIRDGDEALGTLWSYLDITALGRQEEWEDSPPGYPQTPPYQWWRWHDSYDG